MPPVRGASGTVVSTCENGRIRTAFTCGSVECSPGATSPGRALLHREVVRDLVAVGGNDHVGRLHRAARGVVGAVDHEDDMAGDTAQGEQLLGQAGTGAHLLGDVVHDDVDGGHALDHAHAAERALLGEHHGSAAGDREGLPGSGEHDRLTCLPEDVLRAHHAVADPDVEPLGDGGRRLGLRAAGLPGAAPLPVGLLLTEGRGAGGRAVAGAGDTTWHGLLPDVRPGDGAALDQTLGHQHLAGLQRDGVRDAVLLADPGLGRQAGVRWQRTVDDLLAEISRDTQVRRLLTECHWPLPSGCTDSNSVATVGWTMQAKARESLDVMTCVGGGLYAGTFSPLWPRSHTELAAARLAAAVLAPVVVRRPLRGEPQSLACGDRAGAVDVLVALVVVDVEGVHVAVRGRGGRLRPLVARVLHVLHQGRDRLVGRGRPRLRAQGLDLLVEAVVDVLRPVLIAAQVVLGVVLGLLPQDGVHGVEGLQQGDLVRVEGGLVGTQRAGQGGLLVGVAEDAADLAVAEAPALPGRAEVVHVDVVGERPGVHDIGVLEGVALVVGGVGDRAAPRAAVGDRAVPRKAAAAGHLELAEPLAVVLSRAGHLVDVVGEAFEGLPRRV